MAGLKLLLDTHIFIALEDPKVVPPATATLAEKAQRHGLSLFLDQACIQDIQRDRNVDRRTVTLSKLTKFPVLERIAHTVEPELIARFGPIKNDNDRCDVLMLDTLQLGIVDFLVTEDTGIHARAERAKIRRRVFTVREALGWIERAFEPREFRLPFIVTRKAHEVSLADPIFASIRDDYAGFDAWFAKCRREHRDCWVVEIEGQLAGLVICKNETHADAQTAYAAQRILKVCTFKMKQEYQGEKFGEQLLKKLLWFAQGNRYEAVYLTAYPKQETLIHLLHAFGFEITRTLEGGELFIEKALHPMNVPIELKGLQPLARDMQVYPRFYDGQDVSKYVIPIQGEFHAMLFPEIAEATQLPLFPDEQFLIGANGARDRSPGNTIRKVYVCRSPTRTLAAGDLLLFYLSKSPDLARSQSLTTVGVVEHTQLATSFNDLTRMVGRRSVYAKESLEAWQPSDMAPVFVIDFLLSGHFNPHIPLAQLLEIGVFSGRPPMSIKRLTERAYAELRASAQINYA
jgi:ribosomal protein S18 acetylase RimI-like enzyme